MEEQYLVLKNLNLGYRIMPNDGKHYKKNIKNKEDKCSVLISESKTKTKHTQLFKYVSQERLKTGLRVAWIHYSRAGLTGNSMNQCDKFTEKHIETHVVSAELKKKKEGRWLFGLQAKKTRW